MFKKVQGEVDSAVAAKNAAAKKLEDDKSARARKFESDFDSVVVSIVMPAFSKFVKDATENGYAAKHEPFENEEQINQTVTFMPEKGQKFGPRTGQNECAFAVTARKDTHKHLLISYYDQRAAKNGFGTSVEEVKLEAITAEKLEAALEEFLAKSLKAHLL